MEFFFDAIHKFYKEGKFLDIKLKSGIDDREVSAHSLIIASAIPELGQVLTEHFNDKVDEDCVLIFPDLSGDDLQQVVAEIYSALIQELDVDDDKLRLWCETICLKNVPRVVVVEVEVDASKAVRFSKRAIKKRKIFDPDFDYGQTKKPRTGGKATISVSKPDPQPVPHLIKIKEVKNCFTLISGL